MSEQKKSFMEELDDWTGANVIDAIVHAIRDIDETSDEDLYATRIEKVMRAIRERVLESYRNGQQAGQKPSRAPARRLAVPKLR